MLLEAIHSMLGKMTERYCYVQRNANFDRSETNTNEFLSVSFLPIDSLCWNLCLHDFTVILSRNVALKIMKFEKLNEKMFKHISTLG